MPTIFNLLAKTCGLSLPEVAKGYNTPLQTVKMWSAGTRSCPENVLTGLYRLANANEEAAKRFARHFKRLKFPINLDAIPHNGTFTGAHNAMLGRIIALLPEDTEYE